MDEGINSCLAILLKRLTSSTMRNAIVVCVLLIGNCLSSSAQEKNARISGVIQDMDGAPVPYTTVILLTTDSVYVAGAVTKDDGSYTITSVRPSTYRIKVQNIEFDAYLSYVFKLADNQDKSFPVIKLSKSVTQLDEMVVTGKKELVEVHPDKMVFNVSSSVNASGNNGLELLSKAPGVLIDPDNNIILQGKGGVRIFINGRPSRLSGSDLATMLQSMQSDNIESIEIITNPSAKYEAEGNAGIINIVLKRNVDEGYNGTIVSNYSKGDHWRSNNGLTINYRGRKLNLAGDITHFDNDFQTDFVDIKEQSGYLLDQGSYGVYNSNGYNFSTEVDYIINSKHSLAFSGRGIVNRFGNNVDSRTSIMDIDNGKPTEFLVAGNDLVGTSRNFTYDLNYLFNLSKSAYLSAEISYGDYINDGKTEQPNVYLESDGTTVNRVVNNEFSSNTNIDLLSAKVDYEKKFEKLTISAGGKYSYINTANEFNFYNVEGGSKTLDIQRSNDFMYTERVSALYLIFNSHLSEKLKLNAGLRMEHTSSSGRLTSQVDVENKDVIGDYTDFFPNIGLSFSNKKSVELNVSLGRRITRPNYQDLNPFESKLSELAYYKGNPFLKPSYEMNYQVSFSYKHKLVISNVYSVTTDYFARILQIIDEKGTFLIPQNMQRITNNGLTVSYPITFTKWWEASSFLNYSYSTYEGDIEGTVIDLDVNSFNFRIQNYFTLPAHITIDATYYYNSPFIWRGSLQIDAIGGVNLGIKKDFFKSRLQLRFTASDIFNGSSDYYYHGDYGGLNINGYHSIDNHRYGAGLTYKFGNQNVKLKKKRSALEEEMKRISD
jgi:iron complex outermembrane recepter protein